MRSFGKGVLRKGFTELSVVKGCELEQEDSPLQFRDEFSAQTFLRRFLRDRSSMTKLRGYLSRERVVADLSRLDDERMIREFGKHLLSRHFRVVSVDETALQRRSTLLSGAGTQPEEKTAEAPPSRRPVVFPEDRQQSHWVRLLVVDDETDEPIPGVGVRVKLPTGEVGAPRTDRSGTIHIGHLPAGTLDILEILDDKALEVVGIE